MEGLQLDRYHLQKQIGGGGQSQVYLAKATYMDISRDVAVKVITLPDSTDHARLVMELFTREVQAIARLNHPHILPFFDYGIEPRTKLAYIVMPLCQQGSLASWCQKRLLPPQVVMHFLHQASVALQQAHDQKIVHKDVKPQNFLIRDNIDNPNLPDLLLTDFGVAKLNTAKVSLGNLQSGTPPYMAPEQWDHDPIYASDQYSLAIMAYELLTGHLPFQGSLKELEEQHHNASPDPPSTLESSISVAIDKVILRALAKKPEDRYPSISEFYKAFQLAVQSSESGADIHVILAISEGEALIGTECPLTLPDGRQITVNVPADTQNNQVIHIKNQGEPSPYGGPAGALIITITVKPDSPSEQMMVIRHLQALSERLDNLKTDLAKRDQAADQYLEAISKDLHALQVNVPRGGRNRLSRWLAILSLLLAVVLVGGSVGLLSLRNQIAIVDANSNAVSAQAATAIAQANATTIANATNPYPSYLTGNGTITLYDPLVDYSSSAKWVHSVSVNPIGTPPAETSECKIYADGYHASAFTHGPLGGYSNQCAANGTNFSNFAFEVKMTIITGDCGGIEFRGDIAHRDYEFEICQVGTYGFFLYKGNGTILLIAPIRNSAISTGLGQSNTLAVVANSSTIFLYVNQQQISKVVDSTYSHGQIGLAAIDFTNPTTVAFRDVKVWTIVSGVA